MRRRLSLFVCLCLLALFVPLAVSAQDQTVVVPVDGDNAVVVPTIPANSTLTLEVPAEAGQAFLLRFVVGNVVPFFVMDVTTPDGLDGTPSSWMAANYTDGYGPFAASTAGTFVFTITTYSEPFISFEALTVPIDALPVSIGSTTEAELVDGAFTWLSFTAEPNQRVDVTVDSAIDPDLLVIAPNGDLGVAEPNGGRGQNPELTAYWLRTGGQYFVRLSSADGSPGPVTVAIIDNPIPELTADGGAVTIVPNEGPQVVYQMTYTAGGDYRFTIRTADGTPFAHPFINVLDETGHQFVLAGENTASLNYTFRPETDGVLFFIVNDNIEPTTDYIISGGAFFAG